MDETPYQKKNRERAEIRTKLKEIGQKLNLGCDFLPMFNGQWVDVSAWNGSNRLPSTEIRISKEELLAKTADDVIAGHQKDFVWLAGKEETH